MEFKVVCIDDANLAKQIPPHKRIKKDEIYTVVEVAKMMLQGGQLGFKLKEIDLTDCIPYEYFSAKRFAPLSEEDEQAEQAVEELLSEVFDDELVSD